MSAGHLTINRLVVRYGQALAVSDVDLDVPAGSALGLVGANGAGKSSVLAASVGLVQRTAGAVEVDGEPLPRDPCAVTRMGVVMVPETRALFPPLTVAQHLTLGARRVPADRRGAAIEHGLEVFPLLRPLLDRQAALLSGGEQGMLALARALVQEPRVLLLDEPSLGLSPIAVQALIESLQRISAEGMTLLVCEQTIGLPRILCERLAVMKGGRVVTTGPTDEVSASDEFVGAMM